MRRSQAAAHKQCPATTQRSEAEEIRVIQTIGTVTINDYCAKDQDKMSRSLINGITGLCQMLVSLFSGILFVICPVKTII